jgi:peptidoglycan hydrolase-like protein with peptidoglycan-binding domain
VIPPPDLGPPPCPTPWKGQYIAHQYQGDALGVPGFSATVDVDRLATAVSGSSGGQILWAQHRLNAFTQQGAPSSLPLIEDGDFGPRTEIALQMFQSAYGVQAAICNQSAKGLAQNGTLDLPTIVALCWVNP